MPNEGQLTAREAAGRSVLDQMLIVEYTSPETTESTGLDKLESQYPDPHTFSLNAAMAAVLALRSAPDVIATGRDVTVLGQPSTTFLSDLLSRTANPENERHETLLDGVFLVSKYRSPQELQSFLKDYADTVAEHMEQFPKLLFDQRDHMQQNLKPSTLAIRRLFAGHLERHLDTARLLHEGGDLHEFDMDLYRDFIDPFYLNVRYRGRTAEFTEQGISGHTQSRLLLDAHHLGIAEYERMVRQPED